MRSFNETAPRSPVDFVAVLARHANWLGDDVNLFRAVPLGKTHFEPNDYVSSLENLGVKPRAVEQQLAQISENQLPCIILGPEKICMLAIKKSAGHLEVIEAYSGKIRQIELDHTKVSLLRAEPFEKTDVGQTPNSAWEAIRDLAPTLKPLLALSMIVNVMALSGPVLVMFIYDTAIPSGAQDLIWSFAFIVVVILLADIGLRSMRASMLARIGAAVERRLSLVLFTKLTGLPLAQLTRSSTHQQMSRIKQFESMRDAFCGTLFVTLFDLPFVVVFLVVIFVVAPLVGLLLAGVICLNVFILMITFPKQQLLSSEASGASTQHLGLLDEMAHHQNTLSHFGLTDFYQERGVTLGNEAAHLVRKHKAYQSFLQNLGQTISAAAIVLSIALASLLAMNNEISFGALVAIATLGGRVLSPVQTLCSSALQIKGLFASLKQINSTLGLEPELTRGASQKRVKTFDGSLSARNIFLRFDSASEPSLSGVSFDIKARSLVALSGKSGAGKSTLLKTLVKLNTPGSGSVFLDGINLKQIMVDDLRHAVSMDVQERFLFDMSLRENLIMGNPAADDATLLALFEALGAERDLRRFYRGLDTDLSHVAPANLTANVEGTLSIIRCLAKPASVYLLDDPFVGMTPARISSIWQHLERIRDQATVIVVTQELEHFRRADQILTLDNGRLVIDDTSPQAAQKAHAILNFSAH